MAKSLGPKPANQGSSGKAPMQAPRTSGTPSGAKPSNSKISFGFDHPGTHGSKKSF